MSALSWDDLPGDSSNNIADMEDALTRLGDALDSGTAEQVSVLNYLEGLRDLAELAIAAIRGSS